MRRVRGNREFLKEALSVVAEEAVCDAQGSHGSGKGLRFEERCVLFARRLMIKIYGDEIKTLGKNDIGQSKYSRV